MNKVVVVVGIVVILLVVLAIWQWQKHPTLDRMNCHQARQEMALALRDITQALDASGVPYWINCGTLLGWYRDGDFICGDNDVDIAVDIEDVPRLKPFMMKLPHFKVKTRYYKGVPQGLQIYKRHFLARIVYADVYFTRRVGNSVEFDGGRHGKVSFKATDIYPLRRVQWKGCTIGVPADPSAWLAANYGPNFMQPCNTPGRPPATTDSGKVYCKGRF